MDCLWFAEGGGEELEGEGRVCGVDKLEFVSVEVGVGWCGKELGWCGWEEEELGKGEFGCLGL